jgi:YbbR domain-containing protein
VTLARIGRFLVRNWPLKLAAVVLATLLYSGLVLSQNTQVFLESVQIIGLDQPEDVVLLTNLPDVEEIRYFDQDNVRVDASNFRATVDLSDVDPTVEVVSLPVDVTSVDPRIQVIDYAPDRVNIEIDTLGEKTVDVVVRQLEAPVELETREPTATPETVTIRGAQSRVDRVVRVEARVQIEPTGIDIDRDVEVVPVDALGAEVLQVDVDPRSVHVSIEVFSDVQTKSLPVNPVVTGTPAAGYEIVAIAVEPLIVSVEGDVDDIAPLDRVDTLPISVSGETEDVDVEIGLALPDGVVALDEGPISVTIRLQPEAGTRTYSVGITLQGARPDRTYDVAVDRVLLTIGGPAADLDRLSPSTLTALVDVIGIDSGVRLLPVRANLPSSLTLITSSPASVSVTVIAPSPTPTVTASATPTAPATPEPDASPTPSTVPRPIA